MGFQIGDKLSLESFSSGIYLCVINYSDLKKILRVVKL